MGFDIMRTKLYDKMMNILMEKTYWKRRIYGKTVVPELPRKRDWVLPETFPHKYSRYFKSRKEAERQKKVLESLPHSRETGATYKVEYVRSGSHRREYVVLQRKDYRHKWGYYYRPSGKRFVPHDIEWRRQIWGTTIGKRAVKVQPLFSFGPNYKNKKKKANIIYSDKILENEEKEIDLADVDLGGLKQYSYTVYEEAYLKLVRLTYLLTREMMETILHMVVIDDETVPVRTGWLRANLAVVITLDKSDNRYYVYLVSSVPYSQCVDVMYEYLFYTYTGGKYFFEKLCRMIMRIVRDKFQKILKEMAASLEFDYGTEGDIVGTILLFDDYPIDIIYYGQDYKNYVDNAYRSFVKGYIVTDEGTVRSCLTGSVVAWITMGGSVDVSMKYARRRKNIPEYFSPYRMLTTYKINLYTVLRKELMLLQKKWEHSAGATGVPRSHLQNLIDEKLEEYSKIYGIEKEELKKKLKIKKNYEMREPYGE